MRERGFPLLVPKVHQEGLVDPHAASFTTASFVTAAFFVLAFFAAGQNPQEPPALLRQLRAVKLLELNSDEETYSRFPSSESWIICAPPRILLPLIETGEGCAAPSARLTPPLFSLCSSPPIPSSLETGLGFSVSVAMSYCRTSPWSQHARNRYRSSSEITKSVMSAGIEEIFFPFFFLAVYRKKRATSDDRSSSPLFVFFSVSFPPSPHIPRTQHKAE